MASKRPRDTSAKKRGGSKLIWLGVIAVLIGALSGGAVFHFDPRIVSKLPLSHMGAGHHTTAAVPPGTVTASAATKALFQQFDTTLNSYQTQPIDAQSGMRLIIPRIKVNAPIVERGLVQGWMVVAPGYAVTHFTFSAYPGAPGNAVLYSHDGTAFRHLDSLSVGDTILVQTPGGTAAFQVRELRVVSPDTVSVLDATQTAVLTLLTCYPYGVDTSRLVVIADRSSS